MSFPFLLFNGRLAWTATHHVIVGFRGKLDHLIRWLFIFWKEIARFFPLSVVRHGNFACVTPLVLFLHFSAYASWSSWFNSHSWPWKWTREMASVGICAQSRHSGRRVYHSTISSFLLIHYNNGRHSANVTTCLSELARKNDRFSHRNHELTKQE